MSFSSIKSFGTVGTHRSSLGVPSLPDNDRLHMTRYGSEASSVATAPEALARTVGFSLPEDSSGLSKSESDMNRHLSPDNRWCFSPFNTLGTTSETSNLQSSEFMRPFEPTTESISITSQSLSLEKRMKYREVRKYILDELLDTEKNFVSNLEIFLTKFRTPLLQASRNENNQSQSSSSRLSGG
jgi:hypothetical protein